jgi:PAS domain S-box-containing protein
VASDPSDRYRRLVELSPDGIFISQADRIVFVNPAAVRLFGAGAAEQIAGKSPFDLFHPASHALMRERVAQLMAGRSVPPAEEKIVRLDGAVTDVEVNSIRLEEAGEPAIQVIVRDITDRKRAEALLRESEERLTLAFAGAREGVWDWNLETGAVFYSPRWKEMLGYAAHEIAPHVSAWEALLHPDDPPLADELHERLLHGAGTYEGEFRLRHKDGHYIHVLSRGLPVRRHAGGPVVRIVGTHLDITESKRIEAALRQSEERLRLAFAGAQEGVWDWNLETNAVAYSPRWSQMLGYREDEIEPHISAWERLVHPDDRARADRANESVSRGDSTYEAEFRLRHKDGHYVHVLSRGFAVRREPGGPVVRIVGTHFDLTERNERARAELLGRLVFAQEDERRRIAREMHDQFGEQLTALGHRLASLREAAADRPELRERIDAVQAVAQQLDRDVDDLVWELRPTALDDLGLRAALTNYIQQWSSRSGISARLHAPNLPDDRLAADAETTLYRIAQEALTNVAKHAQAKHVEVILERTDDHVVLIVEDDGVGFATDAVTGGFGLLGMQERASLVGATLEIESAADQGTTILVRVTSHA